MKIDERNDRYGIRVGGRVVSYIKRVHYGQPLLEFQSWPAVYRPSVARGWLTTCRRYWADAEMVPLEYNKEDSAWRVKQ